MRQPSKLPLKKIFRIQMKGSAGQRRMEECGRAYGPGDQYGTVRNRFGLYANGREGISALARIL
jgi:hypothetical protein